MEYEEWSFESLYLREVAKIVLVALDTMNAHAPSSAANIGVW